MTITFTVSGSHVTMTVPDALSYDGKTADAEIQIDVKRLLHYAGYDAMHAILRESNRWVGAVRLKAVNIRAEGAA